MNDPSQDTDTRAEDIMELTLCEYEKIFLHPHVLYRFVPMEGCKRCEELAAMYEDKEYTRG